MPVQPCTTTVDGESRPGRRWGDEGTCYPCSPDGDGGWDCDEATQRAIEQGVAIGDIGDESEATISIVWRPARPRGPRRSER